MKRSGDMMFFHKLRLQLEKESPKSGGKNGNGMWGDTKSYRFSENDLLFKESMYINT